ncbi:MAG: glycosyltransferase, partial [Cytophagales bacterium]|nr:glycosyltransferase [Cytophagales bacterium]
MSFRKLASLAVSAIFSFSNLPVKLCLYTGLLGMIIFFAAGVYTIIDKILGTALPGWSSIVLSIYFLGSVQLVFMGIVGEYLFMVYREVQNRPIFIVKEFVG